MGVLIRIQGVVALQYDKDLPTSFVFYTGPSQASPLISPFLCASSTFNPYSIMTKTIRYETLEGRKDDAGTGARGPAARGG